MKTPPANILSDLFCLGVALIILAVFAWRVFG